MICETTVKKFCCEDISKIENYTKAVSSPEMWECHHKMELIKTGAVVDSTRQDLIDWGIYYNRPADELIFMTKVDHVTLHHKGKKRSKDVSRHISEAKKGKSNGHEGKKYSEEWKRKMSEAHKGKPSPRKGKHWKLVDGKRVWY